MSEHALRNSRGVFVHDRMLSNQPLISAACGDNEMELPHFVRAILTVLANAGGPVSRADLLSHSNGNFSTYFGAGTLPDRGCQNAPYRDLIEPVDTRPGSLTYTITDAGRRAIGR
jgi:hypothetical protein